MNKRGTKRPRSSISSIDQGQGQGQGQGTLTNQTEKVVKEPVSGMVEVVVPAAVTDTSVKASDQKGAGEEQHIISGKDDSKCGVHVVLK